MRTLFFIARGRPGRGAAAGQAPAAGAGPAATITAGSQATEMTGAQLPCLIAWAAEATATNTAASPAMRYNHLFHDRTAGLLL